RSRARPGGRARRSAGTGSGLHLASEASHDDLEQAVEGVAHGPRLRARIVELLRPGATVAHRLLGAAAGAREALLHVERGALVDVVAGGEVLVVVDRRAHVDGLAHDVRGVLQVLIGAAGEERELVL